MKFALISHQFSPHVLHCRRPVLLIMDKYAEFVFVIRCSQITEIKSVFAAKILKILHLKLIWLRIFLPLSTASQHSPS